MDEGSEFRQLSESLAAGRWDAAEAAARHLAHASSPGVVMKSIELLSAAGRMEACVPLLGRLVALSPEMFEARMHLAAMLNTLGRPGEAVPHLEYAVKLQPGSVDAHLALGQTLLYAGDFVRGYAECEWRWKLPGVEYPALPGPRWDGTIVPGRKLLLFHSEGFGDFFHTCGYVPLLAEKGMRIFLTAPTELARLMRSLPGVDQLLPPGSQIPPFDAHQALMSLPACVPQMPAEIRRKIPYLSAEPATAAKWRARVQSAGPARLRVGIAWSGNPAYAADAERSLSLTMLAPLAGVAGVQLHSLQKRPGSEQIRGAGFPLIDHAAFLSDFAETAGLIESLDLVISVDTAVAHLAGAMGKPVWILLRQPPDARWMMNSTTTPWYPSAKLFRQPRAGDWNAAVATVARELAQFIDTSSELA